MGLMFCQLNSKRLKYWPLMAQSISLILNMKESAEFREGRKDILRVIVAICFTDFLDFRRCIFQLIFQL